MHQLELIQSKIYEIRGQRVMLDFDLAEMYGTETKQLKRAVRRNIERFEGEDFMFELTNSEVKSLINSQRCQFGTLRLPALPASIESGNHRESVSRFAWQLYSGPSSQPGTRRPGHCRA